MHNDNFSFYHVTHGTNTLKSYIQRKLMPFSRMCGTITLTNHMHNANLKCKKWGEFARKENLPYRKKCGIGFTMYFPQAHHTILALSIIDQIQSKR